MRGILEEGDNLIAKSEKSLILDAGIIAGAQKVEHYEISGYSTVRAMAELLGQADAADLLQETLEEEIATDEALTDICDAILTGDNTAEGEDLEEEDEMEEAEIDQEA